MTTTTSRRTRNLIALIAGVAAGALLAVGLAAATTPAAPAAAQNDYYPGGFDDGQFLVGPVDVRRGAPGTEVVLDEVLVPPRIRGRKCDMRLTLDNGRSVHPGNTIIIRSASTETFENVESVPNSLVDNTGVVTLGVKATMSLRFGPSGVSSAGFVAAIACDVPATTTTVPATTTTAVTVPPTSAPPTTGLIPPVTLNKPPTTTKPPTSLPPTVVVPPVIVEPDYTG